MLVTTLRFKMLAFLSPIYSVSNIDLTEILEFVEFFLNFGFFITDFRNSDLIAFKWDGNDGAPL